MGSKYYCGQNQRTSEPTRSWLALLAAFYTQFLGASSEVFFSVCYIFLMEKYEASRGVVGIAASLSLTTGAVAGVIGAPFIDHYGCRRLMFFSTIMVFIGFVSSYPAPNLYCFHLFYGGLAGAGWILNAQIGHVVVQQAFTINRGLATGIALMGLSAGTMLGPFFVKHFVNEYGVSGALLLMSGIHAQMFILAFAVPPTIDHANKTYVVSCSVDDSKEGQVISNSNIDQTGLEEEHSFKSCADNENFTDANVKIEDSEKSINKLLNDLQSINQNDRSAESSGYECNSELFGNVGYAPCVINESTHSVKQSEQSYNDRSKLNLSHESQENDFEAKLVTKCQAQTITKHTDNESHSSLTNVDVNELNVQTESSETSRNSLQCDLYYLPKEKSTNTPTINTTTNKHKPEKGTRDESNMQLKNPFSRKLFSNRLFVMYIFVRFTWLACKYGLANHCVTAAVTKGIPVSRAVYLPSVIGLGNLLLRILSSFLLNINNFNKNVYFLCGILCNMSAALVAALASNFEGMVVAMALVGIHEGISTTSQPVVLLHMIGLEAFTRGFSIINLTMIPASLIAAPFYGYLADISGGYFVPFLIAFGSGLICSCLVIFIIILQWRMPNKNMDYIKPNCCDVNNQNN